MSSLRFFFDDRWVALDGIGRFAREVFPRLRDVSPAGLSGSPLSCRGLVHTTWFLRSPGRYLLSPGFNGCLAYRSRMFLTIHDLIHLHFPDERTAAKSLYYAAVVRPVVRASGCVFTVSEHAKASIVNWGNLPEESVVVVQNGLSAGFSSVGDSAKYGVPYFLYVGNWKRHKNVSVLVEALKMVTQTEKCLLVCSGHCGEDSATILREVGFPLDGVRFLGRVDDAVLAAHYRGALATIMPSTYEGFGLPVLEAMGCGCPVVSSNATSLPEVGGEAPLYFNPDSVDELVDHLKSLIAGNIDVEALRKLGLDRAKVFTWDAVGERMNDGLQRVRIRGC